jgi:hypothetical protein
MDAKRGGAAAALLSAFVALQMACRLLSWTDGCLLLCSLAVLAVAQSRRVPDTVAAITDAVLAAALTLPWGWLGLAPRAVVAAGTLATLVDALDHEQPRGTTTTTPQVPWWRCSPDGVWPVLVMASSPWRLLRDATRRKALIAHLFLSAKLLAWQHERAFALERGAAAAGPAARGEVDGSAAAIAAAAPRATRMRRLQSLREPPSAATAAAARWMSMSLPDPSPPDTPVPAADMACESSAL